MLTRVIFPVLNFRLIRRTILSVLIGLMGGGVAVLAQQATDAPASPAAIPAAPASPTAATDSSVAVTPPANAAADATTPATPVDPIAAAQSAILANFTPAAVPEPIKIGADGQAVDEPMDKETARKVKKLRDKFKGKEKLPKQTPVDIVQATLTVDGWTGKARMNYDIADLKYLYVWAPGVGTVLISPGWFEAGDLQMHAFSGNTLTVEANGHTIQITSEKPMLPKKQTSAFVYVDKAYIVPSTFPVMGYGTSNHAPYAWPGAKNVQLAKVGVVAPPPLPKDLRPVLAVAGCAPVGSKAALGQTPCTEAVEAARRKAIADAAAAARQTATTATQPTVQTP